MAVNQKPLRLDIISDVVCPWCIVGYKQLEQAMAETGIPVDIHWHPFELNPNMEHEGENLAEHIVRKYGASPEDSKKNRDRLVDIGKQLGIDFNYSDDMRIVNTFKAHQLLNWASEQGKKSELKQALFTAYFTDHKDIRDNQVLAEIAETIGLDKSEAVAALESGKYASAVRQDEQFWTSRGINSVPSMVFEQKHLVPGAQGVENYVKVLRHLASEQTA